MEKKSGQEKQKSPALEKKKTKSFLQKSVNLLGGEGPLGKQYKVGIVVSRYLKKGTIKRRSKRKG